MVFSDTVAQYLLNFVDYGIAIVIIMIAIEVWKLIFFTPEGEISTSGGVGGDLLEKWKKWRAKGIRSEKWLLREFKEVEDLEAAVNANNLNNMKSSLNKVQRAERRFFTQMEQATADAKSLSKTIKDAAEKRNLLKIINELAAVGRQLPTEISDMRSDLGLVEAGKAPQKPLGKHVNEIKELIQGATELIEELKELETKYTQ